MLSLFKISLPIILTILVQYADGNQRIIYVRELINENEDLLTSGEDDSNCVCCIHGNCSCNSLDQALANLTSNVVINITTDVTLSSIIKVVDIENVTIIGHNKPTVNCKGIGGIHFSFCHNCTIQHITWHKCGAEDIYDHTEPALKLSNSFNITINNCIFQHSKGQAVLMSEVTGEVNINHCNFVHNNHYKDHGAAIHYSSSSVTNFQQFSVFTISDCNFAYNYAKSLVYIENRISEHKNKISFRYTKFCHNQGVSVYAVTQNIYLNGTLLFQNNTAENGTGIYISDHSTVIFGENSNATFTQNFAKDNGGTIFLRNSSSVIFDQNSMVTLNNNDVTNGGTVYSEKSSNITFKANCKVLFSHNSVKYGGAIFSYINSRVIFEGNSTILISNNTADKRGGAIYSDDNSYVHFEENSSPVFCNNSASYGGAIYSDDNSYILFEGNSSAVFSDNATYYYGEVIYSDDNNSYIFIEGISSPVFSNNVAHSGGAIHSNGFIYFKVNSSPVFNNNIATESVYFEGGGAIHCRYHCVIFFEGNSSPIFSENTANGLGGAICTYEYSYIIFKEHSTPVFISNTATSHGGALYVDNSYISFQGNSSPVFSNNSGDDGGAIFSTNVHFEGGSSVFRNNIAKSYGGAVYCSDIFFKGNSSPMFSNNSASNGGAVYSTNIHFEGDTASVFGNNTAESHGGAIYCRDNSYLYFEENSSPVFSNNVAHFGGALSSVKNSYILFGGNSSPVFSTNTADCGGAIHSDGNSYVLFKGSSTAEFSNNIASNYGGAACSLTGNISFEAFSAVLFSNNMAEYGGAVFTNDHCNIIFSDNSTVTFADNNATFGATVFTHTVITTGNSTVVFNGLTAKWCNNSCFPYSGHGNVVTIDSHGIVWCSDQKAFLCLSKKCYCNKLEDLLDDLKSNTIVNITDNATLFSVIELQGLHNISIIAYNNITVICGNGGRLYLLHCHDLMIEGITWIGCGSSDHNIQNHYASVIYIRISYGITIQDCTFQYSFETVIFLSFISEANINRCSFMYNNHHIGHGAIIYGSAGYSSATFTININNCNFSYNGDTKSIIYFGGNHSTHILLNNCHFHNNRGVSFYLADGNNLHITGVVLFESNVGEDGVGIYVTTSSTVTFEKSSNVKFINNSVYHNGAAIYLSNQSNAIFTQSSTAEFNNNKATNGTIYCEASCSILFKGNSETTFTSNSATLYGAAIYSFDNSHVTFAGNSTVTFTNNVVSTDDIDLQNGGTLYSENNCSISFEENALTMFSNNIADYGSAIFSFSNSRITFKDNSTVTFNNNTAQICGVLASVLFSSIIYKGNTMVSYNTNKILCTLTSVAASAMCSFQGTVVKFSGHSSVTYTNNTAGGGGAVVVSDSKVIIEEYSTVTFNNNIAQYSSGGAFTCYNNSNVTIKGNSNVTFSGNKASQNGGAIYSYDTCKITFKDNSTSTFISNTARNNGGALLTNQYSEIVSEGSSRVTFDDNTADYGGASHCTNSTITFKETSTVSFHGNKARQDSGAIYSNSHCILILEENAKAIFNDNKAINGGAVGITMKSKCIFRDNSTLFFYNNLATDGGGAIKVFNDSNITLQNTITIRFTNNSAQYGGAIFLDKTAVMVNNSNKNRITFENNFARILGESVYQYVADLHNSSWLNKRIIGVSNKLVATPPNELKFNDPAVCIQYNDNDTQCNTYYIQNVMLGIEIAIPVCVFDYYTQSVDSIQFLVQSVTKLNYSIKGPKHVVMSCDTFKGISIIGNQSLSRSTNFSITITLNTALYSDWKQISVNLIIELLPCHPGFWQYPNSTLKGCECYNANDIVYCSGNGSTIKRGYWFGVVTGKPTVTFCPISYCNFTCCETSNGYYHLSPVRGDQCRSHRSGTACGSCEEGYSLSFDSVECIDMKQCNTGQTILLLVLILLYWILIIAAVFSLMHFKVGIGYLYAITYYYSVVDLLLNQNLYFSNALNTTVNIMSSIAKIIPQFLGQFCFITNMSGIDQQFIHYMHPIAIAHFLVMIVVLARRSRRLSSFISKGIIHVICCLLLLSYTSFATTSLLLMRPLTFHDVDKVYTYVSPDIEYFHGRHLAYAIVAMLFTILIVIGLPLLLALEPFLNSKINFVKIKPLLDQFQSCYKDKYRCFAAYYMICRLVIITIIIASSSNDFIFQYLLITACVIMDLIHHILRPYSNKLLNMFDGVILHLLVLVAVLPLVEIFNNFDSNFVVGIALSLVILPILIFIVMSITINKEKIRRLPGYCYTKCSQLKLLNSKDYNEIPLTEAEESSEEDEYVNVIDNSRRANATICDV